MVDTPAMLLDCLAEKVALEKLGQEVPEELNNQIYDLMKLIEFYNT